VAQRAAWFLVAAVAMSNPAAAAPFTFTFDTIPVDGALTAAPGQTVGWGYTITNEDPANWLELLALDHDPFVSGTPNSLFDFPILAPGASVTVPYDFLLPAGLFEFTLDPGAPNGLVNAGRFVLTGDFWDDDPLGAGNPLGEQRMVSAPYSVTAVPEPASVVLLGTGAAGLLARRVRRRARP
jgi:hypothetical protein